MLSFYSQFDAAGARQASAIIAIDTFSPGTFSGIFAPWRAGFSSGNHFAYSSLRPGKSSGSVRITVALTALASELPAASRMTLMLRRHCAVCS